ncbi:MULTISPECIES: HK97-gp10 family putative phage morphogenesis protein [unclassified Methylibium]|uniref:HK97-gp10 family putative phage morphogenesis protein n=1 Tax=unclassified Methylibium TaxID=2633235 RepID=UPI0003F42A8C|nr:MULTISPECIES: HK97-gp10 family putative phage morphogenesis protein [unclassified Methylibium]EWS53019.1 phage protein, HK97 gp10 family [Methylibium sp. T29]EWS58512.1 phage protein, HK97 gp10 family [Methylibium sp. T29-B]
MADVKLNGVDALVAKLDALKYETRYKAGRFALRKAAQVIRNRAREAAAALDDAETGRKIADNITEKWNNRLFKRTGDLAFRVGVQGGAKVTVKGNPDEGAKSPTPHWRLLEFGTENMAARPFMRPAGEQSAQAATDEFIRQYGKAIDRAIKKGR